MITVERASRTSLSGTSDFCQLLGIYAMCSLVKTYVSIFGSYRVEGAVDYHAMQTADPLNSL